MRTPHAAAAALALTLVVAAPAAAKPRLVGSTAAPRDASFESGLAAGPDSSVWAPSTASRFLFSGGPKSRLIRVSKNGKAVQSLLLPAISLMGVGNGVGGAPWLSGYSNASGSTVSYVVRYDRGRLKKARLTNGGTFESLAVANGVAWGATAFNDLLHSRNGTSWATLTNLPVASRIVAPASGGRVWFGGEGGIALLNRQGTSAELRWKAPDGNWVPALVAASDGLWFSTANAASGGNPFIGRLPLAGGRPRFFTRAMARRLVLGPDARPWALFGTSIARIERNGTLTRVNLPRHYTGTGMVRSGRYVWVSVVQPYGAPQAGKSLLLRYAAR